MADRVKVYEEKKNSIPVWAWLLPLLLLLGLLALWFTRNRANSTTATPVSQSQTGSYPSLGSIHFATDQATLTPDDRATLDRAAESIKNSPGADLRVEGYTDSAGSDAHNLTLSHQRANAVATYLKSKGVDGNRLTGEGFGKEDPTGTNATQSGKADNRRVELFSQQ
jgi:outer membrane protein OmpA-like peptidoglycan-associated protein